jgi:hypothetical protein
MLLLRGWVNRGKGKEASVYCESLIQTAKGEGLMAEQRHGRYYAQELMMDQEDANVRELIQDALDAGEHHEWHLVGVSDVVAGQGVMLFWDTSRPGFGRTSR